MAPNSSRSRFHSIPAWQVCAGEEALQFALHGGDDYELLFSAPAGERDRIRALSPAAGVIGRLRSGSGILLTGPDGHSLPIDRSGFDHFAQ